jgi:peptidoglycan/LPS O-acetylase OafA/YrhL/lysophospholipase L1-like esterase
MIRETAEPTPAPQAQGTIPGLDGLRAVSVLAVMLYHGGAAWMKGGYLGVEIFFVISGFLITTLLLREWEGSGRIALGAFWIRRARRLVPALTALLLAMLALGAFWLGPKAAQYRADLVASAAYGENWHQIASGSSYFADQGLPVLRHLWSLAVEGQFYLLWPLLLMGLLRASKRWRPAPLLATALLGLASAVWMAWLADPHNPSSARALESLNRAYLGTDTRAFGLLAGALLALVLARKPREGGRATDGAALAALAGLLALCASLDSLDARLYRGGFLLVDGLTILVILGLALPRPGLMKRVLGLEILEAIGRRSYSLYLWHWPVFRLVAPGQEGPAWTLLRWALSFTLAEASYRFVEAPFRTREFLRSRWADLRGRTGRRRQLAHALTVAALLMGTAWSATALARQAPYVDEVQEALRLNAAALDSLAALPAAPAPEAAPAAKRVPALVEIGVGPLPEGLTITAIGDSVMKGAALALKAEGEARLGEGRIAINAEESRPFAQAVSVVKTYKAQKRLGDVVVIHLGTNNSSIPESQFQRLMELLADRQLVLFLTAKSDKEEACEAVNRALLRQAAPGSNARVLDWNALGAAHPELFYEDRTHLRPGGTRFYADSILAEIAKEPRVKAGLSTAAPAAQAPAHTPATVPATPAPASPGTGSVPGAAPAPAPPPSVPDRRPGTR